VIAELSPTILCLQEIQDDTVLSVLVEILKKEHNLSYSHHWSGVRSERNAQSVGLLIQDTSSSSSSPVKVEKMGTYLWPTDPVMVESLPTLPNFSELPPEARYPPFLPHPFSLTPIPLFFSHASFPLLGLNSLTRSFGSSLLWKAQSFFLSTFISKLQEMKHPKRSGRKRPPPSSLSSLLFF
jgi:hypothetical protein